MRCNHILHLATVRRALSFVTCAGILVAATAIPAAHAQDDIAQRPYVSQHVSVPTDFRPYVVAPNTVFVAGNDVLIPLFTKLDARWAEVEPNIKFQKIMMGSTLSVEGLVSEKSAFGPIGRGNRRPEVDQFVQRFGYEPDRKSTRLNSSHLVISYAVFCLKK